jgi:phosphatidylglycerol:prolipoprotein diacylglycerol transferase
MWRLYKNNLAFIRFHVTLDSFFDSVFFFFVSFGIGARLLHIGEHLGNFGMALFRYPLFLHFPGFSFLGGIVGGVVGLWIFATLQKKPFFLLLDLLTVGTALTFAFSRIGSLLNGDSYGKQTSFPFSVHMAGLVGARHPVQLYEALFVFAIFAFLYSLYVRAHLRDGELFLYFLLLIGFERFFIEFLRGDSVYLGRVAVAQVISFLYVLVSLLLLLFLKREHVVLLIKSIAIKVKRREG